MLQIVGEEGGGEGKIVIPMSEALRAADKNGCLPPAETPPFPSSTSTQTRTTTDIRPKAIPPMWLSLYRARKTTQLRISTVGMEKQSRSWKKPVFYLLKPPALPSLFTNPIRMMSLSGLIVIPGNSMTVLVTFTPEHLPK
jgi:hypothetical protein